MRRRKPGLFTLKLRELPAVARVTVGYAVAMRLHISLDDELVAALDAQLDRRQRSAFISDAIKRALTDRHRWELIESAIGSIGPDGGEWGSDPAAWVHSDRRNDDRRVG